MDIISHIGRYTMMLYATFSRPDKLSVFWRRVLTECVNIGISSLMIVLIISLFIGISVTTQVGELLSAAWIPDYTLGYTLRQMAILEFSPTIISLILAGKVGSNIAGEIGTMRVTEQIDALDIMGVNSQNYLILPKIVASMFTLPLLVIYSMVACIYGGYFICELTGLRATDIYIDGIRTFFYDESFTVWWALLKPIIFGFIIASISAYYGYYTKGGALDVGKSGTKSVVTASLLILAFDVVISSMMFG